MENSNQSKQYPKVFYRHIKYFVNKKIHIIEIFNIDGEFPKMIILFMTEDSNDIFVEEFEVSNSFVRVLEKEEYSFLNNFDVIVRSKTYGNKKVGTYLYPEIIN